jgi:hypothetical protein
MGTDISYALGTDFSNFTIGTIIGGRSVRVRKGVTVYLL